MIKTLLIDGKGNGHKANIDKFGALSISTSIPEIPVEGTPNRVRFYSAKFGTSGAESGTVNANVDGSVTAKEFYIESHADYDLHITEVTMIVADAGVTHNGFGGLSALTNGIDLIVSEAGQSTYAIQAAKTGGQLIARSGFHRPFGSGADSWELTNWTATEDAQIVVMPFSEFIPTGLRIGRGTQDRISLWVRDNLTGLTEFTIRAFGYRLYP